MAFEVVQISHEHTLRLATAEHGGCLFSHGPIGVQANDLGQPDRVAAGDDRESQRQFGCLGGLDLLHISLVWRFAVVRVAWSCEIFGVYCAAV